MIYKVATALALTAVASASRDLYSEDHVDQKSMWESFKTEFGRVYETMEEEQRRFNIFVENLKLADMRNVAEKKNGGSAVHGVTRFSDLSQAEFSSRYTTADPSMRSESSMRARVTFGQPDTSMGLIDWTGTYTTPVKDQVESDYMRTVSKDVPPLSAEQVTQCDKTAFGCGGGWTEHAYNYLNRFGGQESEADYPYTSYQGVTGTCKDDVTKAKVKVNGYTTIQGESDMAAYVQTTGPLSVCLDASSWNSYRGGIMTVCGQSVDHCVQAVGVDASQGGFWQVRNSWGTGWGEKGFIRLAYGHNTCNIASDPTWVSVSKA